MNFLKKLRNIILAIILSIAGIFEIVIDTIVPLWNASISGTVWFAILYQPFLAAISSLLLLNPILIAYCDADARVPLIILIIVIALTLAFTENAAIELICELNDWSDQFQKIQFIQQYSHNYALILVSLAALYFTAFPPQDNMYNLVLLAIGILYFITTVCSDAYRVFIFQDGAGPVKDLALKVKALFEDT